MLVAEGLHKRYGPVAALAGFDLSIAAGEVAGLIGRNGAGKSTFAAGAGGILRPHRGPVRVDGLDLPPPPPPAPPPRGLAGPGGGLLPAPAPVRDRRLLRR